MAAGGPVEGAVLETAAGRALVGACGRASDMKRCCMEALACLSGLGGGCSSGQVVPWLVGRAIWEWGGPWRRRPRGGVGACEGE